MQDTPGCCCCCCSFSRIKRGWGGVRKLEERETEFLCLEVSALFLKKVGRQKKKRATGKRRCERQIGGDHQKKEQQQQFVGHLRSTGFGFLIFFLFLGFLFWLCWWFGFVASRSCCSARSKLCKCVGSVSVYECVCVCLCPLEPITAVDLIRMRFSLSRSIFFILLFFILRFSSFLTASEHARM